MGMYHGFIGGWGFIVGVIGLLLLVGLVAVGAAVIMWQGRRWTRTGARHQREPSVREVLELRYARGELSRQEFLCVIKDLSLDTDQKGA